MPPIPRDPGFDGTLALLAEGYPFISTRCRRYGSDLFETRLMLRKVVCMTGPKAAQTCYVPGRFTWRGHPADRAAAVAGRGERGHAGRRGPPVAQADVHVVGGPDGRRGDDRRRRPGRAAQLAVGTSAGAHRAAGPGRRQPGAGRRAGRARGERGARHRVASGAERGTARPDGGRGRAAERAAAHRGRGPVRDLRRAGVARTPGGAPGARGRRRRGRDVRAGGPPVLPVLPRRRRAARAGPARRPGAYAGHPPGAAFALPT